MVLVIHSIVVARGSLGARAPPRAERKIGAKFTGDSCKCTPRQSVHPPRQSKNKLSYKLCSLMYRVVHGSAPTYLTELCQPCSDIRLRSTSRGDFIVPRFNRQLSNSSFSVAAPSAWNRLPSHIRTSSTYTLFLTRLKTHLFAESLL